MLNLNLLGFQHLIISKLIECNKMDSLQQFTDLGIR